MGERERLAPETFRLPVKLWGVRLEGEPAAKVGRELRPSPRLQPVA